MLWFRPVSPDLASEVRSFADVVGNVAEYVFEKPELLEATTPETLEKKENDVRAGGRRPDLRVMGASALSPASIDPATPQQLTQGRMRLETGFSDVGFRLAFTTGAGGGAGTPARRLELVLSRAPYLSSR